MSGLAMAAAPVGARRGGGERPGGRGTRTGPRRAVVAQMTASKIGDNERNSRGIAEGGIVVDNTPPPCNRDDDASLRGAGAAAARSAPRASRRALLASLTAAAAAASSSSPSFALTNGAVSEAWATVTGSPSDLTFPEEFMGSWVCYSKLTGVETPQGEGLVQDMAVVARARTDVDVSVGYPMRFIRNSLGRVVLDRAYNVVMMAEATSRAKGVIDAVEWDVDDPNTLRASIRTKGEGRNVFFRVNQRSEEYPASNRIETSEVAQIVFDNAGGGVAATDSSPPQQQQPKVKSSRTFTKWKWRPAAEAGDGPVIVASQIVADYLTSFDPGFIESKGQPVTEYAYKLAMFPAPKEKD